jgi:hypothetical protein
LVNQELHIVDSVLFSMVYYLRSSRLAHTFPLMKSIQKSRQNNDFHPQASAPSLFCLATAFKNPIYHNVVDIRYGGGYSHTQRKAKFQLLVREIQG